MLPTSSQRAYPKYGLATLIVAFLLVVVPALVTFLIPQPEEDEGDAGASLVVPVNLEVNARTDARGLAVASEVFAVRISESPRGAVESRIVISLPDDRVSS